MSWWDMEDVEVEANGEVYNVAFRRRVGDDGAEYGVDRITVHTHERGPVPAAELGIEEELDTAIRAWCQAHPMPREVLHGPGPWYDG